MSDLLVGIALSNLVVSSVLALAAYGVHRLGRYPVLAHLLWVLVLIKLITPPLWMLPIAPAPAPIAAVDGSGASGSAAGVTALETLSGMVGSTVVPALLTIWAVGAVVVFVISLVRIYRFDRLLRLTSTEASPEVQALARGLAWPLGMDSVPTIHASSARLSPLTWWTGGRVRIVIPDALPHQVDAERLAWVIAHELAHVKRRDYLVRWLEWLACVAFWWNPVVWFARRNLRDDEEASCDAMVVDGLGIPPRSYASTLLTVVEFLSDRKAEPPAVATGIDALGSLEKRLLLIVGSPHIRRTPRWLVIGAVSAALVLMPLGVGTASVEPTSETGGDAAISERLSADDLGSIDGAAVEPSSATGARSVTEATPGSFAMISATLGHTDPITEMSVDERVATRTAWATTKAQRSLKRALRTALRANASGDAETRRSARRASTRARARLAALVEKGALTDQVASDLLRALRAAASDKPTTISEADLEPAVAAGVLTQRQLDRLLTALG